MSTYYQYQEVGVLIAHRLMQLDGWKVYGYKADQSDMMTDYYDPAHWGGVAEKNGYVFCFNVYGAEKEQEIRKYNYNSTEAAANSAINEKIKKLQEMTVEKGASQQEEETAQAAIKKLLEKSAAAAEGKEEYIITGKIPAHMAHPPKMNWHIEKDNVIIAKGNGVLKYAEAADWFTYPHYIEDMKNYRTKTKEAYIKAYAEDLYCSRYHRYNSIEEAEEEAARHYDYMAGKKKIIDDFNKFINKIDTTCGGLIGEGDQVIYEKVIKTEYKTELKPVETSSGSIKEGQCFILKTSFNYGRNKGLVYRIHETVYNGSKMYHAYKLNGKYTKECTGRASSNNYWGSFNEKFLKWIEAGYISWCKLEEVKTPYEVEKVVKKVVKASNEKNQHETKQEKPAEAEKKNYNYIINEDIDTRTNEKIFLVRIAETLSKQEYIAVNNYIKKLGGYYSKFKHAFLFKEDPAPLLL